MSQQQLDVESRPDFQRREWRIQRAAWMLWAAFIAAGLAGLLGPGPMSQTNASSSDNRLTIKYNRFAHKHHRTHFEVMMRPADEKDDTLRLHISQSLLDGIDIERIEPEPDSRELNAEGATYVFRCQPGAASTKAVFHIEHDSIGSEPGQLQLAGGQPVDINFFVYP